MGHGYSCSGDSTKSGSMSKVRKIRTLELFRSLLNIFEVDVLGVGNVVLEEIRTMASVILTSDVGGPS